MKKIKKKSKAIIITIACIASIILVFLNINNILYLFLEKYEYDSNGYATGSTVYNSEVVYVQINQDMYQTLIADWTRSRPENTVLVGKMFYNGIRDGTYLLYGSKATEDRVLLVGNSTVIINDTVYPMLYFCRQDILHKYQDNEEE